jgi:hypothetical protein
MSAGFPQDKNAINSRAGSLSIQARDLFTQIQNFQTFLGTLTNQNLLDLGFAQADVDNIKSAFTQLDALRAIATGATGGQTAVNDYLLFAKRLIGPN